MSNKISQRKFMNLVGFEIKTLSNLNLPLNRDVLRLFYCKHRTENFIIRNSAKIVLSEVIKVWSKFSLPTNNSHRSILKIENLYNNWRKVQILIDCRELRKSSQLLRISENIEEVPSTSSFYLEESANRVQPQIDDAEILSVTDEIDMS
ncbi:hypothetical protein PV326_012034, partial [Microctonus aethiopoides]